MSKVGEFLKESFKYVFDEKYRKDMKETKALEKLINSLCKKIKKLKKRYKNNKDKSIAKEIEVASDLLSKAKKHLKRKR